MSDARVIEQPVLPPFMCLGCGKHAGVVGSVIDTQRDIMLAPRGGRLYICLNCVRLYARLAGFSKGKKLDELHEAASILESAQKEKRDLEKRLETQAERMAVQDEKIAGLEEQLSVERGKVAQLQKAMDRAKKDMSAQLVAVGGSDGE